MLLYPSIITHVTKAPLSDESEAEGVRVKRSLHS